MSSPRPGRPVDGAKRALILQTASRHFLQDGFAATSIEQIAAEAGVSKVTIYNHFGDKEALFSESVATECERISGSFRIDAEPDLDLRQRLIAVGESLSAFLSRPEMVQFERRIAAETEREPAVGAAFLSAGPHRMKKALVALLVSMNEAGEVDIADPDLAADLDDRPQLHQRHYQEGQEQPAHRRPFRPRPDGTRPYRARHPTRWPAA